jgi:nicotinate-nucleotide pyrophosphorylase (carboxylating)
MIHAEGDMHSLNGINIDRVILCALEEDMPFGDITTDGIIDKEERAKAVLIAKQDAVLAGLDVFMRVFDMLGGGVDFRPKAADGQQLKKGDVFLEFEGPAHILLKGERTALNILQYMSGIATRTSEYCKKVSGLPVKVTDTRKTVPGLRLLSKYAVRVGGGYNQRFGLSDGVLIKDNHIKAAGGIKNAVSQVRKRIPHTVKIEVETESLEQVREALDCGADTIMLDNMSIDMMKEAVRLIGGRAETEASGNIRLENIYDVAMTGVDIISVGELTHSVKAVDISMRFVNSF